MCLKGIILHLEGEWRDVDRDGDIDIIRIDTGEFIALRESIGYVHLVACRHAQDDDAHPEDMAERGMQFRWSHMLW